VGVFGGGFLFPSTNSNAIPPSCFWTIKQPQIFNAIITNLGLETINTSRNHQTRLLTTNSFTMTRTIASFLSLMMLIAPSLSNSVVETYPLRRASKQQQQQQHTPQQHTPQQHFRRDQLITFSDDDGTQVNLQRMTLELYETSGELSSTALEILQLATRMFLEAELAARFETTVVTSINVTIAESTIIELPDADTRTRTLRQATQVQVDATVNVEPVGDDEVVPESEQASQNALNILVADITQDMGYWVTNVTGLNNAEFANLYGAERTDMLPTLEPTAAPTTQSSPTSITSKQPPTVNVAAGANQGISNNTNSDEKELSALIPAAIVAAGVFLLTALLFGVRSSRGASVVQNMDDYSEEASRGANKELEQTNGNDDDDDESPPWPQQTIHMEDGQTMIHLPSVYANANSNHNTTAARPSSMILSVASSGADESYDYDQEQYQDGSQFHGGYTNNIHSPLRDDQPETPSPQRRR
jgi:hypothetical protein